MLQNLNEKDIATVSVQIKFLFLVNVFSLWYHLLHLLHHSEFTGSLPEYSNVQVTVVFLYMSDNQKVTLPSAMVERFFLPLSTFFFSTKMSMCIKKNCVGHIGERQPEIFGPSDVR